MEKNLLMYQCIAIVIAAVSFIVAIAITATGEDTKWKPISWLSFVVSIVIIFVIQSILNTI